MNKKTLTVEDIEIETKRLKSTLRNYKTIKQEVENLEKKIKELEEIRKNKTYWDYDLLPKDISKKINVLKVEKMFAEETMKDLDQKLEKIRRICGEEGYELFKAKYIDYLSGEETALKLATSKRAVYAKIAFYINHVIKDEDIKEGETPWKTVTE